jgi:hypothetical protein
MVRPPFGSPEWLANFEEVVRTSKTTKEAVDRLGYATPSVVYYHLKRFGIERPRVWDERPSLREFMQRKIPVVIIPTTIGRRWVAGLVQGETCIQSIYRKFMDTTYLDLDTAMVDPAPIFRLSEYYQMPPPSAPIRNHDWSPQWRKNVHGLRALRVLMEITPFLLGEKRKKAEKALNFFSPYGNHRGCYRNGDIWPRNEFPLRTKRRGSASSPTIVARATRVNGHVSGWSSQPKADFSERSDVPEIVIGALEDRSWVGGLAQGEGCTQSHYAKIVDSTAIELSVSMIDPAPVFQFSDIVGLARPSKPKPAQTANPNYKPKWLKSVIGLRALRVLKEIQPFLFGEKSREVEKALTFFSPTGYRQGHFRPIDIWPREEFPLRRRLEA